MAADGWANVLYALQHSRDTLRVEATTHVHTGAAGARRYTGQLHTGCLRGLGLRVSLNMTCRHECIVALAAVLSAKTDNRCEL